MSEKLIFINVRGLPADLSSGMFEEFSNNLRSAVAEIKDFEITPDDICVTNSNQPLPALFSNYLLFKYKISPVLRAAVGSDWNSWAHFAVRKIAEKFFPKKSIVRVVS